LKRISWGGKGPASETTQNEWYQCHKGKGRVDSGNDRALPEALSTGERRSSEDQTTSDQRKDAHKKKTKSRGLYEKERPRFAGNCQGVDEAKGTTTREIRQGLTKKLGRRRERQNRAQKRKK